MRICKLAIAAAAYFIDRPYDYIIPESLYDNVKPGVRVLAPFGRGNRKSEGVVLGVSDKSEFDKLKVVEAALDDEPVIDGESIRLALWMSDRFFCTVYDAIRAMLPSGLWFRGGKRVIGDKTFLVASLSVPVSDALLLAEQKKKRAPAQAAVLELLSGGETVSLSEIEYLTGAKRSTVNALVKLGAVCTQEREVFRRPAVRDIGPAEPIVLNRAQDDAYRRLCGKLRESAPSAALLYGVTGSGKTSVYIKLIEEVLSLGKSAIALVPEIALTPQLTSIFVSHFGENVAVLHSALGVGERYDEWKRINSGNVHVVVGTRSAVFAPVHKLGLIIIDEEQEHTYKSENSPRYHARDVAKYRCARENALLLLGSATPSVESMYSAVNEKYALYRIAGRFNRRELPRVLIADMKEELKAGNGGVISALLEREIRENLTRGEQSILFINRRGAGSLIACPQCGYTYTCVNCSVSMTYHSANGRMMCHYCGYSQRAGENCPECGGRLKTVGAGTQSAEAELCEKFPDTAVIRMDADTVSYAHSHEKLLSEFRDSKTPILLGTQMVAKGLDFENVTLVGVLSADNSLYVNDYRAHERTFSLITQVIGRSGRGEKEGRAVIQTYTPSNEVIRLASGQDYDGFYERDISLRGIIGAPPFFDLVTVTAAGADETAVLRGSVRVRDTLTSYLSDLSDKKILGPAPEPIVKVNNRYRYRVILACKNSKRIRDTVAHIIREFSKDSKNRGVSVFADINP